MNKNFLTIFITALIFLLLVLGFFHEITAVTQDLGRHLTTGNIILATGNIPKTNLFSYTYPSFPFINHHWLSEVVFAALFPFGGFGILLALTILLAVLSFGTIYFYGLRHHGLAAVSITSLFYLPILFERTDVRPELFSFLFLSLFIVILYAFRNKPSWHVLLLIPIELLWVNIHIYFIVGVAVTGIFLIDLLFMERAVLFQKRRVSKKIMMLLFTLAGVWAVTLINPNGIAGAFYPFRVFSNYGYAIEENQNIFFLWSLFHKQTILFFFLTISFLFFLLLFVAKKIKPVSFMLALFFAALAITAERNFPLFVFGTFLSFTDALSSLIEKRMFQKKPVVIIAYSLFFAFLFFVNISFVLATKKVGANIPEHLPDGSSFFLSHNLKGPIFNNFDNGGYLIYRLYPKELVFTDSRPEAYPTDFFQKTYIPMQQDSKMFSAVSNYYNFNAIIFGHTDQTPWAKDFLRSITSNTNWSLVYVDSYTIIFLKKNQENQPIITKLGMDIKSVRIDDKYLNSKDDLYRLIMLAQTVGWPDTEKALLLRLLQIDPASCPALANLARLTVGNSYAAAIYQRRYLTLCR